MIQFISHFNERFSYIESIRIALDGGCRWIQLRMKEATTKELLDTAIEVRSMCDEVEATLIIDDRVDVTIAAHADGVHLGQNDLPVKEARKILGTKYIIGGTANTIEQVKDLSIAGADYIGCGPFRFTTTKQGLAPLLGLDGYRHIVKQMEAEGIDLPIVAIGGITNNDIPAIMSIGITSIAMSGSVLRTSDPIKEMKRIIRTYTKWTN